MTRVDCESFIPYFDRTPEELSKIFDLELSAHGTFRTMFFDLFVLVNELGWYFSNCRRRTTPPIASLTVHGIHVFRDSCYDVIRQAEGKEILLGYYDTQPVLQLTPDYFLVLNDDRSIKLAEPPDGGGAWFFSKIDVWQKHELPPLRREPERFRNSGDPYPPLPDNWIEIAE